MHVRTSLKPAKACWLWGDDEVRNCSGRGGNPVTRSSQDPPATLQEGCRYYRGARVGSPIKKIYGGHRAATKIDSSRLPKEKASREQARGLWSVRKLQYVTRAWKKARWLYEPAPANPRAASSHRRASSACRRSAP